MLSVTDAANQAYLPLSVVFAGDSDLPKWLGQHGAGITRTLQIDHFQNLLLDFMFAVLQQWGAPFQILTEQVSQNIKRPDRSRSAPPLPGTEHLAGENIGADAIPMPTARGA
jgi:hypothetical protein